MKLRTPLDRRTVETHFRYHKWQYLLILVLPVVAWNLIYAQTAYRVPQDKRLDVYIQSSTADQDQVNAFLKPIWEEAVPEQELVSAVLLLASGGEDDYYANVQLVTYLAAAEGDIYLLSSSDFKRIASQGAFVPLEPYRDQGLLDTGEVDISAGYVQLLEDDGQGGQRAGERRLFGIPAFTLYNLASELRIDNRDKVFAIAGNSGNEEAAVRLLSALVARTTGPMPDFFKQ